MSARAKGKKGPARMVPPELMAYRQALAVIHSLARKAGGDYRMAVSIFDAAVARSERGTALLLRPVKGPAS